MPTTCDTLMWYINVCHARGELHINVLIAALFAFVSGMILWCSEKMSLSGSLVALFMIATSVGGMLGPPIVGQLFDRYSPMWMVYVILIVAIFMFVIYVIMVVMELRKQWQIYNPSDIHNNIPLRSNYVEHSTDQTKSCESQT